MKYIYFLVMFVFVPVISSGDQSLEVANSYELLQQEKDYLLYDDPEKLVLSLAEVALNSPFEMDEITSYFDLFLMSKFILGKDVTIAQQNEFIDVFMKFQMLKLAPRIKDFAGNSVTIKNVRIFPEKKITIVSIKLEGSSSFTDFDFVTKRDKGGFVKAIDVRLDGISIVTTWKASVRDLIKQDGFEGMLNIYKQKLIEREDREHQKNELANK